MKTLSVSSAKAQLNDLVEQAVSTQEHITITRNGSPAAVMVSVDEWESVQETLYWLSQPGIQEDLAAARRDYAEGRTLSGDELRARLGMAR